MAHEGLTEWGVELPIRDLSDSRSYTFELQPSSEVLAALAEELDFSALRKLRFKGKLSPIGKRDWHLKGVLGATVVQPCVATLVPVSTRLEETIDRSYLAGFKEEFEEDSEEEMPEDESTEALPAALMLSEIATEALALSAPRYPRAEGAELGVTQFTESGKEAMTDEAAKPFAALKSLINKEGND